MRAIVFDQPGGPEVLRPAEVSPPQLAPGQVRIAVTATSVNRADLLQRRGLYPPPPGVSEVLGLECCGVVTEVADGVRSPAPGNRVMALLAGGGYAEEAVVDWRAVLPAPTTLSDAEAGAFPEVFLTAFLNLFQLGGLTAGGWALVHGGSGGVGTAAIALAREAGARIAVTAGSPERCRRCLALGADIALDYRTDNLAAALEHATGGEGVDLVMDCVGGSTVASNLSLLRTGGRLVQIGLMGGARTELDLRLLMSRRLTLVGSTLRSRPDEEKGAIVAAFLGRFGEALRAGRLRPVIHRVLPLAAAAEAHRLLESGEVFGKIALDVRADNAVSRPPSARSSDRR